MQCHPSIEVAVDQLEGIDRVKEVRGGVIPHYLTDALHPASKILQELYPGCACVRVCEGGVCEVECVRWSV